MGRFPDPREPRDLGGTGWRFRSPEADGDVVEETDNLADPKSWQPLSGEVQVRDGRRVAVVRTGEGTGAKFYRVRRR